MERYLKYIKGAILAMVLFFFYKSGKDSEKLKKLEEAEELRKKYEDINNYPIIDDIYLSSNWVHKDK